MINIYLILNIINGKVYIGKTKFSIEKRFKQHKKLAKNRVNRYLYDAMNKYGFGNFKVFLIEVVNSTLQNEREIFWISKFKSNNPNYGYNMTIGGDGGATITGLSMSGKTYKDVWKQKGEDYFNRKNKERSKKLSKALKGRFIGRVHNNETKAKIRESLNKYIKQCKESGNIPTHWFTTNYNVTGLKHSEDSKREFSKNLKGKSYEQRYGKVMSEKLKCMRKERISGIKNHNYIPFDIDKHLKDILTLKNLKKLCKERFGITYHTLLYKFKIKYKMTIKEYKNGQD